MSITYLHALKTEDHIKVYLFLKPDMFFLALIFESFKQLAICIVDFEEFDGKLVLKGEPLETE